MWDPINTRVAADRTPDNVNGYLLGCTLEGCEVGVKETTDSALGQNLTNNPAWGSEYWGTGTARGLAWNYELAFVAPFLDNWRQGKAANTMGMAQWYLADTPGETGQYVEAGNSTTAPGNSNAVRSLGASSMDQNRFPKLLYYVYEAAWTPFTIKPVVRLAGHWNLSAGNVQVNAFSNCPSVELLVNGVQQGSIETPNPWNSNDEANQTQTATADTLPDVLDCALGFRHGDGGMPERVRNCGSDGQQDDSWSRKQDRAHCGSRADQAEWHDLPGYGKWFRRSLCYRHDRRRKWKLGTPCLRHTSRFR